MKESEYDVIVLGSGPGGEGAAIMASKNKKKVLVVEKNPQVGGGCTHWGTIPSKAIRNAIMMFSNLSKTPVVGKEYYHMMPNFVELLAVSKSVVHTQVNLRQNFYNRNYIEVRHGEASFIDANTIEIVNENKESEKVRGKYFVIATGSRPYHPKDIDFSHPLILDSDKVLSLTKTPRSIIIYGAGVVGAEYACIFRNIGIKVNLINTRDRLLDYLDDEISQALAYNMRSRGIVIRNQESFDSLEVGTNNVILNLKSGKRLQANYIFWAQGRQGNADNLNLEKAEIEITERGNIKVDGNYRTNVKNIFAVGDVVGWPNLAGAAYDQGRHAGSVICELKGMECILHDVPTGIYTDPEISCIGKTERELTKEKVAYEVGIARFKDLAKAQMLGDVDGMLKILFHRETLKILGIHCFGREASEILHIGQAIMLQENGGNTIRYFLTTTFNYPTMAEAYRVAALNGINRIQNDEIADYD